MNETIFNFLIIMLFLLFIALAYVSGMKSILFIQEKKEKKTEKENIEKWEDFLTLEKEDFIFDYRADQILRLISSYDEKLYILCVLDCNDKVYVYYDEELYLTPLNYNLDLVHRMSMHLKKLYNYEINNVVYINDVPYSPHYVSNINGDIEFDYEYNDEEELGSLSDIDDNLEEINSDINKNDEIDSLLDKILKEGYDKLTDTEKQFLKNKGYD